MSRTTPSSAQTPTTDSGVLEKALAQMGHFGLYQQYMLLMLCLPNLISVMYTLNYVFVADRIPFRCEISECEALWSNEVVLEDGTPQADILLEDHCSRRVPRWESSANLTCDLDQYVNNASQSCNNVLYLNKNTAFAEFDLGCNEWRWAMIGTVRNSALPVALFLTGFISDKFGRRTALCLFASMIGLLGTIKGLSYNYTMYITLEFFEAALGYGFTNGAYVILLEVARPPLRSYFACATGVTYGLGGMLFALIAANVPYWRHLIWTIYPPALLLTLYRVIVDESPRWTHSKGKYIQTSEIIRKAARWNKSKIDEELMKELEKEPEEEDKSRNSENPWWGLVRSRRLMLRFALCSWCWVASAFVYYGLTINSVSLSGNKYMSFALSMAMEVVASLLLMMTLERFGRKACIFCSFVVCAAACVTPYAIAHQGASMGLLFVGKLSISYSFNSLYVYTAELFPTSVRSSALSAASLVGRIGSTAAPLTALIKSDKIWLLYGVCALLAAFAVILAPETKKMQLKQHV